MYEPPKFMEIRGCSGLEYMCHPLLSLAPKKYYMVWGSDPRVGLLWQVDDSAQKLSEHMLWG